MLIVQGVVVSSLPIQNRVATQPSECDLQIWVDENYHSEESFATKQSPPKSHY